MTTPWLPVLREVNCYRVRAHTDRKDFTLVEIYDTREAASQAGYYFALDNLKGHRWLKLADGGHLRTSQIIAYTVEPWYDPRRNED